MESFEAFRETGFHANSDPPDISIPFIELIQRSLGFKIYTLMTNRHTLTRRTEKQQIEYLYGRLVADNLVRYRSHPELRCFIEENDGLRSLARTLPGDATRRAEEKLGGVTDLPTLAVQMVGKTSLMSIAIVDYVMHAVSRWARNGYVRNPSDRIYRTFRAVEPTISLLHLLEDGTISSRKLDLH